MLKSYGWRLSALAALSLFFFKLSNLKILMLSNIIINEDIVSVISKLSLLKAIFLEHCVIADHHLSKIFETCTALKEIRSLHNGYGRITIFPPQMNILCIKSSCESTSIDLLRCIQLQSL
jgi:hypothetical protein